MRTCFITVTRRDIWMYPAGLCLQVERHNAQLEVTYHHQLLIKTFMSVMHVCVCVCVCVCMCVCVCVCLSSALVGVSPQAMKKQA